MWRKARHASFEIAGDAEGFIRFHADRISVSGTSSEEYRESRDSTVGNISLALHIHMTRETHR
jgi:hypothetical protein